MDRIKTGIPGFDELIDGGLPKGKTILLSGTPGTCKTIFALQYIFNGADKYEEKGLYITFEEPKDNLYNQSAQFGWDMKGLAKKKKVKIISIPGSTIKDRTAQDIIDLLKKDKYKRLVIDSLSALAINTPTSFASETNLNEHRIQRFMYAFINKLQEAENVTALLVSQTANKELSRDTVSEFICDGVIFIDYEPLGGDYSRNLSIRKMRQTKNDENVHPIEINNKGLTIHNIN